MSASMGLLALENDESTSLWLEKTVSVSVSADASGSQSSASEGQSRADVCSWAYSSGAFLRQMA